MKVVTYANNYHNQFYCILRDRLGVEPLEVIDNNFRFYHKILSVDRYIQNLHDNEIIVFLDAFYVLPVNGVNKQRLEYAINKCFDLNKVTFNAEVSCFPDDSLSSYFQHIPSKWKYLNSGIYVGKVINLKLILSSIINQYINNKNTNEFEHLNDQLLFMTTYIKKKELITIDWNCEIFQTLFSGDLYSEPHKDIIIDANTKIIKNQNTNTYPLLVHGNGKVILDKILSII